MRKKTRLLLGVMLVTVMAFAVPAAAAPPSGGHGTQFLVVVSDGPVSAGCDDVMFTVTGWLKLSNPPSDVEELAVAHLVYEFYDGDGNTFTWVEAGAFMFRLTPDGGWVAMWTGRIGNQLIPPASVIGSFALVSDGGPPDLVVHGLVGDTQFEQACNTLA